jgi:ribosome-associated protein
VRSRDGWWSVRDLELADGTIVPASLLHTTTSRSGGPGGQNVNKVETRVTIEVPVDALPLPEEKKEMIRQRLAPRINREGMLRVTSQAARSQIENRDRALIRLEELLDQAMIVEKPRRKTRASRAAKEKRLQEKKMRGERKKMRGKVST